MENSAIVAFALGLVQGLSEYLPISSSGHLVLAQRLFNIERPELAFDIVLHLGTLVGAIFYYRNFIAGATRDSVRALGSVMDGSKRFQDAYRAEKRFKLFVLIIVATIPTAMIGLALKDWFEALYADVGAVGVAMLISAVLLAISPAARGASRSSDESEGADSLSIGKALLIGLAQGVAIVPGISRSGITIVVALFLGAPRADAIRFSFMISIPAILGATILKFDLSGSSFSVFDSSIGFLSAAISGLFALIALVKIAERGKLAYFAPYMLLVGAALTFYGFSR